MLKTAYRDDGGFWGMSACEVVRGKPSYIRSEYDHALELELNRFGLSHYYVIERYGVAHGFSPSKNRISSTIQNHFIETIEGARSTRVSDTRNIAEIVSEPKKVRNIHYQEETQGVKGIYSQHSRLLYMGLRIKLHDVGRIDHFLIIAQQMRGKLQESVVLECDDKSYEFKYK